MRRFDIVPLTSPGLAIGAARFCWLLRGLGEPVRKGIEMLIGTFCILGGHTLPNDNRDFSAMQAAVGV